MDLAKSLTSYGRVRREKQCSTPVERKIPILIAEGDGEKESALGQEDVNLKKALTQSRHLVNKLMVSKKANNERKTASLAVSVQGSAQGSPVQISLEQKVSKLSKELSVRKFQVHQIQEELSVTKEKLTLLEANNKTEARKEFKVEHISGEIQELLREKEGLCVEKSKLNGEISELRSEKYELEQEVLCLAERVEQLESKIRLSLSSESPMKVQGLSQSQSGNGSAEDVSDFVVQLEDEILLLTDEKTELATKCDELGDQLKLLCDTFEGNGNYYQKYLRAQEEIEELQNKVSSLMEEKDRLDEDCNTLSLDNDLLVEKLKELGKTIFLSQNTLLVAETEDLSGLTVDQLLNG